jgi:hypothetical protein
MCKLRFTWLSSFRGEDFLNLPIRNKNCLWRPCLLTNWDEMSNLYRGPSYQVTRKMRLNVLHAVFGGVFFSVRLGSSTSTKVTYTEIKSIILDIFDHWRSCCDYEMQNRNKRAVPLLYFVNNWIFSHVHLFHLHSTY